MKFQVVLLVLLSRVLAQSTPTADTDPESITAQPLFASQKPCAHQFFFPNYLACPVDAVASTLGCQYGANCPPSVKTVGYEAANNCYCRTDLQPVASRYLSSCVLQTCACYRDALLETRFVPATTTVTAAKTGQGTLVTSVQDIQSGAGTSLVNSSGGMSLITGIATSQGALGSSPTSTSSSNGGSGGGSSDGLTKQAEIATIIGTIVGLSLW